MTKVPPFFSADPASSEVYHDCEECERGQKIPLRHRRIGRKQRDQCRRCKELLNGTPGGVHRDEPQ